jgi:hypothetical protein
MIDKTFERCRLAMGKIIFHLALAIFKRSTQPSTLKTQPYSHGPNVLPQSREDAKVHEERAPTTEERRTS